MNRRLISPTYPAARQKGATLLIAMIMLVVLTLFVISAVRLSNVNLQIVGNYQWQKEMEVLTDSALEQLISTTATFDDPAVQDGTAVDKDICADGTVVAAGSCATTNPKIGTATQPRCTRSGPATGYTIKVGELTPDDDQWILKATATDSVTGAKVTIYRGVTVRMLAGHCPA